MNERWRSLIGESMESETITSGFTTLLFVYEQYNVFIKESAIDISVKAAFDKYDEKYNYNGVHTLRAIRNYICHDAT